MPGPPPEQLDTGAWDRSLRAHVALVAEAGGKNAGFGRPGPTGLSDRLYVGKGLPAPGRGFCSGGGVGALRPRPGRRSGTGARVADGKALLKRGATGWKGSRQSAAGAWR